MTSKIILKKSSVVSKVPVVGDLEFGELALNYADGKLYYKNSAGTIALLNPTGSGGGGASPTTGQATLDFGAYPGSNEASVTVTGQTSILTTSVVSAYIDHTLTSIDHTATDHEYFTALAGITVGAPTLGSGFVIKAKSLHKLTGTWTVRWSWV